MKGHGIDIHIDRRHSFGAEEDVAVGGSGWLLPLGE